MFASRQAEMTQRMKMEADTVFPPGDQILAVRTKDGSVYWHDNAGVNISQLSKQTASEPISVCVHGHACV